MTYKNQVGCDFFFRNVPLSLPLATAPAMRSRLDGNRKVQQTRSRGPDPRSTEGGDCDTFFTVISGVINAAAEASFAKSIRAVPPPRGSDVQAQHAA